jgi:ubiquitin-conjugating enzyme E2 G1
MNALNNQSFAIKKLRKEFTDINEKGDVPFTVGLIDENDMFKWEVLIVGPENTIYEGGVFSAILEFPQDYPNSPPKMSFTSKMWHPNIFKNGSVCISILHPPVIDHTNLMERLDEKWRPVLGVKEIVLSVLSMLCAPNLDSPANVDAAIEYKNNYEAYKKKVRQLIEDDSS